MCVEHALHELTRIRIADHKVGKQSAYNLCNNRVHTCLGLRRMSAKAMQVGIHVLCGMRQHNMQLPVCAHFRLPTLTLFATDWARARYVFSTGWIIFMYFLKLITPYILFRL